VCLVGEAWSGWCFERGSEVRSDLVKVVHQTWVGSLVGPVPLVGEHGSIAGFGSGSAGGLYLVEISWDWQTL
jgi:hypothetical protein